MPNIEKWQAEAQNAKWDANGKRRQNARIAPVLPDTATLTPQTTVQTPKRVRQSSKALLNGLETEFFQYLKVISPESIIKPQSFRVRLANGAWFKVDFLEIQGDKWIAHEIKGWKGKNIDRGKLALKVAASLWPEIRWVLHWKDPVTKDWIHQRIKP